MIRTSLSAAGRAALALVAVLIGASCQGANEPTAIDPALSTPADTTSLADSAAADSGAVDSLAPALASVSYTGLPYGPFGLWASATTFDWGPAPFTISHDNTFASSIVTRVNTARQKGQRLVLEMTGGNSRDFKTNGKFDYYKWKNRMDTFKTTAIRNAVAAGVADGTILGNSIMDEPETPQWGGVMTKPLLDKMAAYVKNIFPTLPVGVNHGGPGYKWRTWEHYKVVDYTLNQYQWTASKGDISGWRDAVLSRSRADGVRTAFSMNLINGGTPDYSGSWDCAGTGGKGTIYQRCRMTPSQVAGWGKSVGPSGCFTLVWRYDDAFMSKSANVDAFRSVASYLRSFTRKSCKR
jgi:hypothetical protein